jgi:lipopolysaccharide export system ATP-binding protein
MSILRAERLTKSYNQRVVVDHVDIQIRSGEVVAFLGRNGAGKTTSFQMMVGLIKPDRGKIYLDKDDISNHPTYQRAAAGITYLPQEDSVFLKATVEENMKLVLELQTHHKKEQKDITSRLLDELGLLELSKQPAYKLSGGERRRLEICRFLILKPKFLLLDEPFTGIDPLTVIELQRIILNQKKKRLGIILSDHNVRDTFKITDRAYIIDEGKILTQGSPKDVAANQLARERFLGKDFKLGGEVRPTSPQGRDDRPEFLPETGETKNSNKPEESHRR